MSQRSGRDDLQRPDQGGCRCVSGDGSQRGLINAYNRPVAGLHLAGDCMPRAGRPSRRRARVDCAARAGKHRTSPQPAALQRAHPHSPARFELAAGLCAPGSCRHAPSEAADLCPTTPTTPAPRAPGAGAGSKAATERQRQGAGALICTALDRCCLACARGLPPSAAAAQGAVHAYDRLHERHSRQAGRCTHGRMRCLGTPRPPPPPSPPLTRAPPPRGSWPRPRPARPPRPARRLTPRTCHRRCL